MTTLIDFIQRNSNAIAESIIEKLELERIALPCHKEDEPQDIAGITDKDRDDAWIKFLGKQEPREKDFIKIIIALFEDQRKEVIRNIKRELGKSIVKQKTNIEELAAKLIFDLKNATETSQAEMVPAILKAVIAGGNGAMAALPTDILFDPTREIIVDYILNKKIIVKEIVKTTNTIVRIALEVELRANLVEGLTAGESAIKIKKRVESIFGQMEKGRTKTIARTEISNALNIGAHEGNIQSGVVEKEMWVTARDELVRTTPFNHAAAEGETVGIKEKFVKTGEPMEFPTDTNGSPGNFINCFPSGTSIILSDNIQGITRRWYEGDLVELISSTGIQLTGTPNHPILTSDGWIPLNLIVKGSDIISTNYAEEMTFSNPNKENKPVMIDEIYRLGLIMSTYQRTDGINMQFHGDGRAGDVDVIFVHGKLQSIIKSSVLKPIRKHEFALSHSAKRSLPSNSSFAKVGISSFHASNSIMSSLSETDNFSRRSSGHTSIHSLTSTPDMSTRLNESLSDNSPRSIKHFSDRFLGLTGGIASDNITNIEVDSSISDGDIRFKESFSDSFRRDTKDFCNRTLGFSRGITIDNVVDVKIKSFSGHVYNLQTKSGWYIANNNNIQNRLYNSKGFIVHNCRCTVIPIPIKA